MPTVLHTKKYTETTGGETTVNVCRLTVRQVYEAARLLAAGDTCGVITLSTGRPAELIDLLPDEAIAELSQLCVAEVMPRITALAGSDPNLASVALPFFRRISELSGGLPAAPAATP